MDLYNTYLDLIERVVLNEINPENGARIKWLLDLLESTPQKKYSRKQILSTLVRVHRTNPAARAALANVYAPRHWVTKVLGFPFSMIGPRRLKNVRYAAENVLLDAIPGVMIETGVWRGGACLMMKAVMKARGESRPLYVCDSFEGLPEIDSGPDKDLKLDQNPLLTAPLEDVRAHFERLELLDSDVHFVKGWFSETMPDLTRKVAEKGIALLRLDGDYYTSTMDVLTALYPYMAPGSFLIVDDYRTYEQCRRATDEYRASHGITDVIEEIDEAGVFWRVSGPVGTEAGR